MTHTPGRFEIEPAGWRCISMDAFDLANDEHVHLKNVFEQAFAVANKPRGVNLWRGLAPDDDHSVDFYFPPESARIDILISGDFRTVPCVQPTRRLIWVAGCRREPRVTETASLVLSVQRTAKAKVASTASHRVRSFGNC